jgi:hypothetical protein
MGLLGGSGGGNAGTVEVDVVGDFTEFERGLDKSGQTAGGRFGQSFGDSFGRKVATLGGAYLGAQFGRQVIDQASDLAEATNVTGLAFGEARSQADAFAKSSATAIGMSESATRALQAQLGNVIVGFGAAQGEAAGASEDLIRRAADIGSAWNAGTDEVTEAIIAAFTTSTEPIRKFGVIIDQAAIKQRALELGLIGAGDELDNNSKRLAVTSLIMEQTNNVAGDFANTSDGVANSSKQVAAMWADMQAQLGQGLLPLLSMGLGFLKQLGPEGMRVVVMGGALLLVIAKVSTALRGLGAAFSLLSANPVILLVAALVAAGVLIWKNWDKITAALRAAWEWIRATAGELGAWFGELWQNVNETVSGAWSAISDTVGGAVTAITDVIGSAWSTISGIFTTAADVIGAVAGTLFGELSTMAETWAGRWTALFTNLFGWLSTAWSMLWSTITTVLGTAVAVIDTVLAPFRAIFEVAFPVALGVFQTAMSTAWSIIQAIIGGAVAVVRPLIDGVGTALNGVSSAAGFLQGVAETVFGALRRIIGGAVTFLINRIDDLKDAAANALGPLGRIAGGVGGALGGAANFVLGRAIGGPMAAGRPYLVGEQGPELVTPGASSYVTPADATAALIGRALPPAAAAGDTISVELVMHVDAGVTDPAFFERQGLEMTRVVDRELERLRRAKGQR